MIPVDCCLHEPLYKGACFHALSESHTDKLKVVYSKCLDWETEVYTYSQEYNNAPIPSLPFPSVRPNEDGGIKPHKPKKRHRTIINPATTPPHPNHPQCLRTPQSHLVIPAKSSPLR